MDFVIDGNAYLNVALSVVRTLAYRDKSIGTEYYVEDIFNDGEFILKDKVKLEFRNFCLNYLHSLIAPVGNRINRVHLAFDSRSWRKDYINKFFDNGSFSTDVAPEVFGYKAKRKKDPNIYLFFEYFQKEIVPALIEQAKINYYRIQGNEGDDIIAYLCEYLKTDVMIYTVDGDIKQLTYSKGKNVIVIYPKQQRKHKMLCVPQELNPDFAEDEFDNFFSMNDSSLTKSSIKKTITILEDKDYVEYKIDPLVEVFTKIFRGDKKDNIPKMDKITPTKNNKMLAMIKEEYGNHSINLLDKKDETFINFIVKNISILNKVSAIDEMKDIREHFMFNASLTRLSSSLFPEEIQESLKTNIQISNFTDFDFKQFTKLKNNPSSI